MSRTIFAATVCASVLTAPGLAQDGGFGFALIGQQAVDFGFNTMNTVIGNNALDAVTQPRQGAGARGPAPAGRLALTAPGGGVGQAGPARPLSYQPSAALERQTIEAFLARLQRNNPTAAKAVRPLLERHGYAGEFRRFIRGTPLGEADAADAVTMFVVMGYLIANQDMRDMPAAHWEAVRNQFRAALGAQPRLADPVTRAALGEEMKLQTAILYGGFDGNRKAGKSADYADGVAAMFRRNGLDLRSMTLDERGLLSRN